MNGTDIHIPDPSLDLVIERVVDVPAHLIWKVWTTPELIRQWFAPKPWTSPSCEIDLRPGGMFSVTMRGPDGEEFSGPGCHLEVIENKKLVWTSAMGPGFRPVKVEEEAFLFTAIFTLEESEAGTHYKVIVVHADAEAKEKHEGMGFYTGWGTVADQAIDLARTLA